MKKKSKVRFLGKTAEEIALEKQYRKLAKRADQRLVRLEGLRHYKDYANVEKYAYDKAMRAIKHYSGEGAARFNTQPPKKDNGDLDVTELRHKIKDIETFLNSATSTKKGIDTLYKKKAEATNKALGVNFTWQEWKNYWDLHGSKKEGNINYNIETKIYYIDKKTGLLSMDNVDDMMVIMREYDLDKIEKAEALRMAQNGLTYKDLK